ncbi:MAG TPA: hypothetical protein VKQ30_18650 [Ktedonobacterales bacterium]|nr:hypothetical protein [Ktedonobacterales bacterium]
MPIVRIPCANSGCGSDLVRDDTSLVDVRTGRSTAVRRWPVQVVLLLTCCVTLAGVQLLRPGATRLVLDVAVIVTFATLSLISLALLARPRIVARLVPSIWLHTYTCQICGYKWYSRGGEGARELPA